MINLNASIFAVYYVLINTGNFIISTEIPRSHNTFLAYSNLLCYFL